MCDNEMQFSIAKGGILILYYSIGIAKGTQGARAPLSTPSIEMLPIMKMSQKRLLFLEFQLF